MAKVKKETLTSLLDNFSRNPLTPLDVVPGQSVMEKLLDLALSGLPPGSRFVTEQLERLTKVLDACDTKKLKVVVFGGGTGLSTIVGGDSSSQGWGGNPFRGLKEIFPHTQAIVCVTDDGGSTGELLKDLPVIGLGDLRHVLLSSLLKNNVQRRYKLSEEHCLALVQNIAALFNFRFDFKPHSFDDLLERSKVDIRHIPAKLLNELQSLGRVCFEDGRFAKAIRRPQCLGNLLIAAAIFKETKNGSVPDAAAIRAGVNHIARIIGAGADAVLPCTATPGQLEIQYSNGVLITGESKSSFARRGYPVDKAFVEYVETPHVLPEVFSAILAADIIIFAPGSLYTSIIPVLQVPGLVDAVRNNPSAVKILAANIWAQTGETDIAKDDPSRRYHVSDLLKAYQDNIFGDVHDLFQIIMLLGLQDIPGSIIQNYAVEGKVPIYCDRGEILKMGFVPVESNIFSPEALRTGTVKHDPDAYAKAVKTLWAGRDLLASDTKARLALKEKKAVPPKPLVGCEFACQRFADILDRLEQLKFEKSSVLAEIFWRHKDIPLRHLAFVEGVRLVEVGDWKRCQEWDNVFSFYDPDQRLILIRKDISEDGGRFEAAFLVALGQSLLGNYAKTKEIIPIALDGEELGRAYKITLRSEEDIDCYFSREKLKKYLLLARMNQSQLQEHVFFRLLNGHDSFTPPGMLFGLIYAWYLDNKFASHIEYKMGISRMPVSNLVPEQIKTLIRREAATAFFREVVFSRQ